jgi:hypothetical protein
MAKYNKYFSYDLVSDSKLEFGTEYITEGSYNGSDGSTFKDYGRSSME